MEIEDKHQVYDVVMEGDNSDNAFVALVHVFGFQGMDEDDMPLCDTTHIVLCKLMSEDGTHVSDLLSHFRFRVSYDDDKDEQNMEIDGKYRSDGKWRSVLEDDIMVIPKEVGDWTSAPIARVLKPYFKEGGRVTVTKKKTELCKGCVQKKGLDHTLPVGLGNLKKGKADTRRI